MPDANSIIDPLAAINPILGVIAVIAIAIVVFLYREKMRLEAIRDKNSDSLVQLVDQYNQAQMHNLETLKDVSAVVAKATESIDRADAADAVRQAEIIRKLDDIVLAVRTCTAFPRQ